MFDSFGEWLGQCFNQQAGEFGKAVGFGWREINDRNKNK